MYRLARSSYIESLLPMRRVRRHLITMDLIRKFKKMCVLLALVLAAALPASAYDFEVDGCYYTVVSIPDLTCEFTGGADLTGEVSIPSNVTYMNRMFTVIGVGNNAFCNNSSVSKVKIPACVTKIGKNAFHECGLSEISIPDGVVEIGDNAFFYCPNLNSISLPNSVQKLGINVFASSALSSVKLSDSLEEIPRYTFQWCGNLTKMILPNSVGVIGDYAFNGCINLESIELSEGLQALGLSAFSSCKSLKSIVIPDEIVTLINNTFSGCESLSSVILSQNLQSISESAFSGCSQLTEITIPKSVKTISPLAFKNCANIETVEFCGGSLIVVRDQLYPWAFLFDDSPKLKNMIISGDFVAPKFMSYSQITNLIIKGKLDLISCSNEKPFSNLEKISIGDDVEVLHDFSGKKLKQITLGDNIEFANTEANKLINFSNSPNLETVTLTSSVPYFIPEANNAQYLHLKVLVPKGSLEAYQNAEGWKNFWSLQESTETDGIADPESFTEIKECARYDIHGRKVDSSYKGLIIIRYSDGSTKKTINRQ